MSDVLFRSATAVTLLLVLLVSGLYFGKHLKHTDNAFLAVNKGDYARAAKLLKRSVDAGSISANTTLANYYRLGLGVPRSYPTAAKMYWTSASAGNVPAMINLALMYREGLGVEQNSQLAYAWFNMARESRSSVAQTYMSEMLAENELSLQFVPKLKEQYSTLASMPEPKYLPDYSPEDLPEDLQ